MTAELQPCPNPWCYATSPPIPIGLRNGRSNPSGWKVECACGVRTFRADTKRQAIAAWNNRPATRFEGDHGVDSRKHPLRPTIEAAVIGSPAIQDHALAYRKAIASDVATDVLAALPTGFDLEPEPAGWLITEVSGNRFYSSNENVEFWRMLSMKADALFLRAQPPAARPISEAPRDKTFILAQVAQLDDDSRWSHLSGRLFVIRHEGRTVSDFDLGWSVYPGLGAPDSWFDRWWPLPQAAEATP